MYHSIIGEKSSTWDSGIRLALITNIMNKIKLAGSLSNNESSQFYRYSDIEILYSLMKNKFRYLSTGSSGFSISRISELQDLRKKESDIYDSCLRLLGPRLPKFPFFPLFGPHSRGR